MDRLKERIYGIVFLGLGFAILWQGRSLTIGSFRSPGSGLFPALMAVVILILALILIIFPPKEAAAKPTECATKIDTARTLRSVLRIALVFAALLAYAFLLEYLGFVTVSFVLMVLLFVAFGSESYWRAILKAVLFTGLAYALFELLLKSNLPRGPLGF